MKDTSRHEVKVTALKSHPILVIKKVVKTMQLGKVMGSAYQRIYNHLQSQGIGVGADDAPLCIYRNLDWKSLNQTGFIAMVRMMFFQNWYLEMGIPYKGKISLPADIESGQLPEGKYITTIHQGSYMKVGETYKRIMSYAENAGLTLKDYSIERYLNDPKQVSKDDLQTEVMVPVQEKE